MKRHRLSIIIAILSPALLINLFVLSTDVEFANSGKSNLPLPLGFSSYGSERRLTFPALTQTNRVESVKAGFYFFLIASLIMPPLLPIGGAITVLILSL